MRINGTLSGRPQPSTERWTEIARAHQGYHAQTLRTKGWGRNIDAIHALMESPVSDHVLDAGWLAVEASALFPRPKGLPLFDLADETWRSMLNKTTSVIDDLQANHALAFLPLFRDAYKQRQPDLRRLDRRLVQLAQRVLTLTAVAESNQIIGVSDEIATTALTNRFALPQGANTAHAWPTATRNDRGPHRPTNTDIDIGEYPSCTAQIQIKHHRGKSGYISSGTPVVSMTTVFPELKEDPMFLMKALAHTKPDDPLSTELAQRMQGAITSSVARVTTGPQ